MLPCWLNWPPSLVVLVSTRGTWLISAANLHLSGCSTEMFLCFLLDNNENTQMLFFPSSGKATGVSVSIFSPFVAMSSKSRSTEKGKIRCELMGECGEACERQQNPQAFSATTQEGRWANPGVLVTLLFPLLIAVMQYKREKLLHVADLRVNCNGWREGNHTWTKDKPWREMTGRQRCQALGPAWCLKVKPSE